MGGPEPRLKENSPAESYLRRLFRKNLRQDSDPGGATPHIAQQCAAAFFGAGAHDLAEVE
jgi:hypothetical protein